MGCILRCSRLWFTRVRGLRGPAAAPMHGMISTRYSRTASPSRRPGPSYQSPRRDRRSPSPSAQARHQTDRRASDRRSFEAALQKRDDARPAYLSARPTSPSARSPTALAAQTSYRGTRAVSPTRGGGRRSPRTNESSSRFDAPPAVSRYNDSVVVYNAGSAARPSSETLMGWRDVASVRADEFRSSSRTSRSGSPIAARQSSASR